MTHDPSLQRLAQLMIHTLCIDLNIYEVILGSNTTDLTCGAKPIEGTS